MKLIAEDNELLTGNTGLSVLVMLCAHARVCVYFCSCVFICVFISTVRVFVLLSSLAAGYNCYPAYSCFVWSALGWSSVLDPTSHYRVGAKENCPSAPIQ